MEQSIFKYILRHSAPQQFYLLAVTVAYYPFLYISLELPKVIVNQAIETGPTPPYMLSIFGIERSLDLPQVWFLMAPEASFRLLKERVALEPDDAVAWYYLGHLYHMRGQPDRGQRCWERSAELGFDPPKPAAGGSR